MFIHKLLQKKAKMGKQNRKYKPLMYFLLQDTEPNVYTTAT